MGEELNFYTN